MENRVPRRRRIARQCVSAVSALLLALLATGAGQAAMAPALPHQVPAGTPLLPTPASWPLDPQPVVLQPFRPPAERWGAGNRGLDLAAHPGDPVLAVADGTVSFAGSIGGNGVVVVVHGEVRTTYTPVAVEVTAGRRVTRGTRLGTVSGSHCEAQPCLHLGLLHGETYLDPALLFRTTAPPPASRPVRLLPGGVVGGIRRRAAERAIAPGGGPSGAHGFRIPAAGPITSPYGMRVHPVTGAYKLHDGTDIGAPCGAPLVAAAVGTVVTVDQHPALGLRVIVDHGVVDGHHVVVATNHASDQTVAVGQLVVAGQVLGHVGSTGLSTGCHLHLMVWLDGHLVDPMAWF